MKEQEQSSNILQTVSRAVAVLRCFDGGAQQLSLAELTRRMGLNKVTVFRLASTLVHEGLLAQDVKSGAYRISYGLIALGRALLDPEGLTSLARPALQQARQVTGETVNLNLREGADAVVVDALPSKLPIRYVLEVGYRNNLKVGAAGLAMLAFMEAQSRAKVLDDGASASWSDGSAVDLPALRLALEQVRQQGYAATSGQRVQGAFGVAVPFFDPSGEVLGSVSVIGPTFRNEDPEHRQRCIDAALAAAGSISAALAGRPATR